MASMYLTWALSLAVLSSCFMDASTTIDPDQEFLYIWDDQIYELPSFDKTCTVPPHPIPGLSDSVAGVSDNSLVICGGYASDYTDSCHTLTAAGWKQTASLVTPVYEAAASQSPYGLMVTGGYDGSDVLSTTQIYSDGIWARGPAIPGPRYEHCQVYVGETVFIAGGRDGNIGTAYLLEEGTWRQLATMLTPWSGHACTVYDGEVYALGSGYGSTMVQIYNFAKDSWRYGPSLPSPVSMPQAFVYGGRVTVASMDGAVYQLFDFDWATVGQIQSYDRHVFPAPVVTSQILKCGAWSVCQHGGGIILFVILHALLTVVLDS